MNEEIEITDRLYYSDLSNKKRRIMQEYLSLLKDKRYSDASNFLNSHNAMNDEKNGVWFIGAELLSFLDNEVLKCTEYANEAEIQKKIFVTLDDITAYPTDIFDGAHWIGDLDLNNLTIGYESGISELYTGNETGLIE